MRLGIGRENAKTQADLARATGYSVREVQSAIEERRRAGYGICSGPEGIWLPENADDLAQSNRRLRSRLVQQYRTLRAQQHAERRMRAAEQGQAQESIWSAA